MMIQVILGAVLIGISLGVFGSGGSILTVPVLMYLLDMPATMAIASSLLIVAGISVFGSIPNIIHKKVSWPHVLLFGLPGMAGTYGGAWLGTLVDSVIQLAVFVLLMLLAAVMMWRGNKTLQAKGKVHLVKVALDGLIVGVITGFVGVGGGFLIVPALVLLGGVPMVMAIGTSLLIIALKSFVGFAKYYEVLTEQHQSFDWLVIGIMIAGGVLGSFFGIWIGQKLPKDKLQKAFSVFLVGMASLVLTQSVL
jgi:uncharacterized membrane protein YfcA